MSSTPTEPQGAKVSPPPPQMTMENASLDETRDQVGAVAKPNPRRKLSAEQRIHELLADIKRERQRNADLARQLSRHAQDAAELAKFRAERREQEAHQKTKPERITKALEQGRKLFADFDAAIQCIAVNRDDFEGKLLKVGPEVMYAAALGLRTIWLLDQFRSQAGRAEVEQQRVEYYRQRHKEHFAGAQNNGA